MRQEQDLSSLVRKTIEQYHMLNAGDSVICGVSGGADSTAMLRILHDLQPEMGFSLCCLTVEHGIRGESSIADARWVENLCGQLQIPIKTVHVNAPAYAREHGLSEEEAGRELRYQAFQEEKARLERDLSEPVQATTVETNRNDLYGTSEVSFSSEHKTQSTSAIGVTNPVAARIHIAVAHTADDNAETMLFNLARGTGLNGLAGIPPVRGDIIRPLIDVERSHIEDWLRSIGQEWRTDETNLEDDYSRNRLRHEAVPVLRSVNAEAVRHLRQTAQLLRDISGWIQSQAKACLQDVEQQGESEAEVLETGRKPVAAIDRQLALQPDVLRREVLHLWLAKAAGQARDITAKHIALVDDLLQGAAGRRVDLPYDLYAVSGYKTVQIFRRCESPFSGAYAGKSSVDNNRPNRNIFSKVEDHGAFPTGTELDSRVDGDAAADSICISSNLPIGAFGEISWGGIPFAYKIIAAEGTSCYSRKTYTKTFDYDKITQDVILRCRRPGDAIMLEGGIRQSLKRYFINAKVPQGIRDQIPLLCAGSNVIWIVGYRISASFKVDETTSRILWIRRLDKDE